MKRNFGTLFRAAAACAVLAACDAGQPPAGAVANAAPGDSIAADTIFDPSEERVTLPSSRIYYTLTNYEWYARGQPLLHEGRAYSPGDLPIEASLDEMSRAGEFQGVEYYVRSGDSSATVYVPVFQGYWQPFRFDAAAAPVPADDAAPAAPADSAGA